MENTTIKLLNDNGVLEEHKILFTFECEELGKHYIAYESNIVGQDSEQNICVVSYNPDVDLNELKPITDEEELKMVNDVLNQIMED